MFLMGEYLRVIQMHITVRVSPTTIGVESMAQCPFQTVKQRVSYYFGVVKGAK